MNSRMSWRMEGGSFMLAMEVFARSIFSCTLWALRLRVDTTTVMVPKMLARIRAPVILKRQTTAMCQFDSGLISLPIKIKMEA
eukprot:CAMPEP_0170501488 /NCGR_PEP_ID=MMETSP0208-20121228/38457_1 /TAXON_ID=197538 /ORGANISM="Strombidium inclinatum, Strain S3" /LENGTH=82 /DNA_ID=CAMNT_0010780063 /DNA_START=22 /DNA_END=270 /DNA_ORIENTATION=+